MIERPNAGDQIAWVALRFWLGAQGNKGGRGQRNREEIGAGATIFGGGGFAAQWCSWQNRHATQTSDQIVFCAFHSFLLKVQKKDGNIDARHA